MSLESSVKESVPKNLLFKKVKIPAKGLAFVLFGSLTASAILGNLDYNRAVKRVNELYVASGGDTNIQTTAYQKAEYVSNQPGYQSDPTIETFCRWAQQKKQQNPSVKDTLKALFAREN